MGPCSKTVRVCPRASETVQCCKQRRTIYSDVYHKPGNFVELYHIMIAIQWHVCSYLIWILTKSAETLDQISFYVYVIYFAYELGLSTVSQWRSPKVRISVYDTTDRHSQYTPRVSGSWKYKLFCLKTNEPVSRPYFLELEDLPRMISSGMVHQKTLGGVRMLVYDRLDFNIYV